MMRFKGFYLLRAMQLPAQRLGRRTISYSTVRRDEHDPGLVKPWYVVEAEKQSAQYRHDVSAELPQIPDNAPEVLDKVVKYAAVDMGLKRVQIIDRRHRNELVNGALNPAFMVVGTGTSTRHLQSAGLQLLTWLKREFHIVADKEGILTTNFVRLHNKRQRRKQQRQRLTSSADVELMQRVGSWIVIDTKLENVYVHLMTQEKRDEVDLEHLSDDLEDYTDDLENASDYVIPQQGKGSRSGNDNGMSGKRGLHTEAKPIPDSREELALQNLVAEPRYDLTEDSTEVKEFVDHFPELPERQDWKIRLRFFAIATVQSPNFSLRRLIDEAEKQQESGFVLDEEDIEMITSSICYHAQSHFSQLARDEKTLASWEQLCDYKAKLLSRLFEFAIRPSGCNFMLNPRLLVLLYRTFGGPSKHSISPEQALAAHGERPAHSLDMFFDRQRLVPLRLLLEETPDAMNMETVGMVLASLVNGESFDAFWKTVDLMNLASGSSKRLSEFTTELALALIVKSGVRDQIVYGIQTFLPNVILKKEIGLTPTLMATVESALASVSGGSEDEFSSVRLLLDKYRTHKLVE